jgi:hypothetical protein
MSRILAVDQQREYLEGCTGGDRLGGAESVPIDVAVNPGEQVTLSVSLNVPNTAGEYRGSWRLYNEQGQEVLRGLLFVLDPGRRGSERRMLEPDVGLDGSGERPRAELHPRGVPQLAE